MPATETQRERDLAAIDEVVSALYTTISGDSEAERDWEASRALFHRLAIVSPDAWRDRPRSVVPIGDHQAAARVMLGDTPFHEWELERTVHLTGEVATVVSRYAAAETPGGAEIKSGVNHFLLVRDAGRWVVLAGGWDRG